MRAEPPRPSFHAPLFSSPRRRRPPFHGKADPLGQLPAALLLFASAQLAKMAWSEKAGALVSTSRTPEELVDGIPLAVGIITLLRQFHPACLERFVSMLSQHVRAQLRSLAPALEQFKEKREAMLKQRQQALQPLDRHDWQRTEHAQINLKQSVEFKPTEASAPNGTRLSTCAVPKAVRLSYRSSRAGAASSAEDLPHFRLSPARNLQQPASSFPPPLTSSRPLPVCCFCCTADCCGMHTHLSRSVGRRLACVLAARE